MPKPLFLIVVLTALVYGKAVLTNDFVEWDDGLLITTNPIVQGLNLHNIKEAFTSYDPELYIPLTFLSYQLDYVLWGLYPVGFHLTNLLLHIGNSILIFLFFMSLTRYSNILENIRIYIALVCAGLFALHPLHTEAVMWASARKDLLMGFFFLLSLNLYIRSCDSQIAAQRFANRCFGVGAFVLACMAKVTAVMLPFALLLIDWRNEKKLDFKNIQTKLPYFLISILFIIIALFGKAGSHGLWWEKVLIGTKATIFYVQKLFWPSDLSVLYPYTQPITISNPDLLVPLVFVVLLTVIPLTLALSPQPSPRLRPAGKGERGYRDFAFGWSFFLLLLLPSFTNFAKGQDVLKDVYFASDRYAYLASIGIIFSFVSFTCPEVVRRTYFRVSFHRFFVGFLGIIGLFGFLSYNQSFVWQTTESLFINVVQHYPNSHVAHNNLGSLLYRDGEIDAAIAKYKESLAVRPNATAFFNLGVIYMENGYPDIAREAFLQALKLNPSDEEARKNLEALGI